MTSTLIALVAATATWGTPPLFKKTVRHLVGAREEAPFLVL
jgi:hypothetical protein